MRRIKQVLPVYDTPFCRASLGLLEQQAGPVHQQRQMLFHEDIGNMKTVTLALVAWVYLSSQVVFLGGEFSSVYARHYGSRAGQENTSASSGSNLDDAGLPSRG